MCIFYIVLSIKCFPPFPQRAGRSGSVYNSSNFKEESPMADTKSAAGAKDKWEFYEDKRGEWRWRRKAVNGEIVGSSSEGYNEKSACQENAKRNGWNGK